MTALGAVTGVALDRLLGEPPVDWHPVARYGAVMQAVEHRLYADTRTNGVTHLAIGALIGWFTGITSRRLLGRHASTALAVTICAAGKMLDDEALTVRDLLQQGDINGARLRVRSLVGRDTTHLDGEQLSRAVIESVAENQIDAVTATILWGALGGPIGAFVHRAVNTLDAMVGHHNERYEHFGWASARIDDTLNFIPARLTAVAIAVAEPRRARDVLRIVRRDAHLHPSPNGGVIEAAFAAALGVTLGGVNQYASTVEDRGTLGDGPAPSIEHIAAAVRLRRRTTAVIAGMVMTIGVIHPVILRAKRETK